MAATRKGDEGQDGRHEGGQPAADSEDALPGVRFIPPKSATRLVKGGARPVPPSGATGPVGNPVWVTSVVRLAHECGLKPAPAGHRREETWQTDPDCGVRFVLRTEEDLQAEQQLEHHQPPQKS